MQQQPLRAPPASPHAKSAWPRGPQERRHLAGAPARLPRRRRPRGETRALRRARAPSRRRGARGPRPAAARQPQQPPLHSRLRGVARCGGSRVSGRGRRPGRRARPGAAPAPGRSHHTGCREGCLKRCRRLALHTRHPGRRCLQGNALPAAHPQALFGCWTTWSPRRCGAWCSAAWKTWRTRSRSAPPRRRRRRRGWRWLQLLRGLAAAGGAARARGGAGGIAASSMAAP